MDPKSLRPRASKAIPERFGRVARHCKSAAELVAGLGVIGGDIAAHSIRRLLSLTTLPLKERGAPVAV